MVEGIPFGAPKVCHVDSKTKFFKMEQIDTSFSSLVGSEVNWNSICCFCSYEITRVSSKEVAGENQEKVIDALFSATWGLEQCLNGFE